MSSTATRDEVVQAPEESQGEPTTSRVLWFDEIGLEDGRNVGGKAASLGELQRSLQGRDINVPDGYVTTARAYAEFLGHPVPPGTWDRVRGDELPSARDAAGRAGCLGDALHALLSTADPGDDVDLHARAALARAFCLAAPAARPAPSPTAS